MNPPTQPEKNGISCLSNTTVGSTDVIDSMKKQTRFGPEKILEPIIEASNLSESQTAGYTRTVEQKDCKDAAKRPKSSKPRRPLSSKMAAARRLMLQIAKLKQKNLEEGGEEDSETNSYVEKVSKEELKTISQIPLRRARFETAGEASYRRFFAAKAGMNRYPDQEIVEEYSPNDDIKPKRHAPNQVAERKPFDIIEQVPPERKDEKLSPEAIESTTKRKRKSVRKRRLKSKENTGKPSMGDNTQAPMVPDVRFSKLAAQDTEFIPNPKSVFGQPIQQSNRDFYPQFPFHSVPIHFHQRRMAPINPSIPSLSNPLSSYNTRSFNPYSQQVDPKPSLYQSPYYFPPYNRNPLPFAEPKLFEPYSPFADDSPGRNGPKNLSKPGMYNEEADNRRVSTSHARKRQSASNENPSSIATTPRRTPSRRPSTSISTIDDVFDSRNPRSHEMAEFPLLTTVLANPTLPHFHDNFRHPRTSIGTSRYAGEGSPFSDDYPYQHHNPFLYESQSPQNVLDLDRPKTTPFFFGMHEAAPPPEMSLSRERAFVKNFE